ncbi:Tex family protein [Maioricimonas sp. JC845]|uniref:Tex family protein n=1 Tax=Maioricimonas sp. JC845 TaxID=3232138 RepID=UPI0034577489
MESIAIDTARVATELQLSESQVANTVALLDEGNTVPFITRYRKERTGGLDEEQIRNVQQRVSSLRQLAERATAILRLIEAQGKLTPQLRQQIEAADTLKRLEDLYLPYRPKRKSRAEAARQRGLEPLATAIWNADPSLTDLNARAADFVDPEKEVPDATAALQGAADILAERIGEDPAVREEVRKITWRTGVLNSKAVDATAESAKPYRDYFEYSEAVAKIPPHRVLALNRGEKEKAVRIKLTWNDDAVQGCIDRILGLSSHRFGDFLKKCADDATHRLLHASLEREVRRELTERAEDHAVSVFARNLRNLLLQPPLKGERVLAIDPGFRTGCKIVVLDELGGLLTHDLVYVTGSAEKRVATKQKLADLLASHECRLIAIGNGTACRETEELVAEMISEHNADARYVIVNEAGASVYSASAAARSEFPDLDATVRGTVSIGRRLLDPLSELVKIDPQHIGVGMYQHDLNEKSLHESLEHVIESCVNYVGVDINSASAALLRHVSGLNQLLAQRVVQWRDEHGRFKTRRQLLDVPGIGEAKFTQAAGFLRISDGDEALDRTWIHPESYHVAYRILEKLGIDVGCFSGGTPPENVQEQLKSADVNALATDLEVGHPTLQDIIASLARPGRDPRTDLAGPVFKQGVLRLEDLHEGMELTGTVLNVVDFGAFVDIGVKDSGLVHISRMSSGFVRNPHDVVSVGDVITVWVLDVDVDRHRVSLTMVRPGSETADNTRQSAPSGKEERREQKPPASGTSPRKPRRRKGGQKTPTPKLSAEQQSGAEPLRGFDELKQLWKKKQN